MTKTTILWIYFIFCTLVFTQCRQPRQTAESSSDEGAKLYIQYCSRCHLGSGMGGPIPGGGINAPDIRQFTKSPTELEDIINNGFGKMPAFKDSITTDNVLRIADYVAAQIEYHSVSSDTSKNTGER